MAQPDKIEKIPCCQIGFQQAEKALELVEELSADLGIPKYLDDAGASKDYIPELVERAMVDNPITTNPRPATPGDIARLYLESFK